VPLTSYDCSPPAATVFINDMVALRYFLLYSTFHHFSSFTGSHFCLVNFSASSCSVSGEIVNPSRNLEGHQFGCTCARCDLCTPGVLREGPAAPVVAGLFWETTLAPKNLRISASLSRWGSETDRREDRVICGDVWAIEICGVVVDISRSSGYLIHRETSVYKRDFKFDRMSKHT
jgi:hypothetical protein